LLKTQIHPHGSMSALPYFRQLKLYFRFGLRLGVMSGDRWNSAKSLHSLPKARFHPTIQADDIK
jgi:hypothetical protein